MALVAGSRLGAYEVLGLLGAGGMGEVYRARDTRLGRDVAVKVLPAGVASDPRALTRFETEARAVAALSHPNILAIHDFGCIEGVCFAVMELLEGETLRESLRESALPVRKSVEYGVQIAEGLAAAHAKGIVHRDVKPENLFVTKEGRIKILDFGLARQTNPMTARDTEAPTLAQATEPGVVVGTLGYLSPEQLRGQPADPRSDIFAFGCVLYEMLSGKRAFAGQTAALTMSAILHEDPPAISVPASLSAIVNRCLEKSPEQRLQSAQDLAFDLRALTDLSPSGADHPAQTVASLARSGGLPRRAAVAGVLIVLAAAVAFWLARPRRALSFEARDWILIADVQNETGQPVFDRSLSTALTVSLEQSAYANVFPRPRAIASLERMKRDPASRIDAELAREICMRENIRALVAPSVARVGSRYALSALIVDPRTGGTVRSFEEQARGEDGVLPALSSLATRIRAGLGESLPAIQRANRPLPQVTTASLRALELYAEGRQLWEKGRYEEAVKLWESAVERDPEFAMAHAALGNAYASFVFNQPFRGRAYYDKALQLASRTTDRERHLIAASSADAAGNDEEAARLYRAYLALYPDDARVRYSLGTLLMMNKRPMEAIKEFREAIRLMPSNANAYINAATSYVQMNQFRGALESYAKAFALEPTWEVKGNLNHEYGFTLVAAGHTAKAREVFGKAVATTELKAKGLRSLALLDLYQGRYRAAADGFREAILLNEAAKSELSAHRDHVFLAIVREGQGDRTGQLVELDRANAILGRLKTEIAWTTQLGAFYARAGAAAQAERLKEAVTRNVQPASQKERSELHRLEGELELARGHHAAAVEKLRLADREFRTGLTLESLAHAAWVAGDVAQAVTTYESLLAMDTLGWEAQQPWVAAHYNMALAYRAAGQPARARDAADKLLTLWREADPDLPLLRKTRELRRQLDQ